MVPQADNQVHFKIEGAGIKAAVGNGDSASLESFQGDSIKAYNGKCLLIVKSSESPGNIEISATSNGLQGADIIIKTDELK